MRPPFPRPSGSLSARIKGAEIILRERAAAARLYAAAEEDPDCQHAAALRGKSRGYAEAAELISRIDRGALLGFRRWTRKERVR